MEKDIFVGGRKLGVLEGSRMVYATREDLQDFFNIHDEDQVVVGEEKTDCYKLRSRIKTYTEEQTVENEGEG